MAQSLFDQFRRFHTTSSVAASAKVESLLSLAAQKEYRNQEVLEALFNDGIMLGKKVMRTKS